MLFHEIYGTYFDAVGEILKEAVDGNLTKGRIYEIVSEKAFSESSAAIPEALMKQTWPLINKNMGTPLKSAPQSVLTLLQKRWLKTLLMDPRIKLFDVTDEGLEDIESLYDEKTLVYFDKYSDGDDFSDERYIENFRTILKAVNEKRKVLITFKSSRGNVNEWKCIPCGLEYSQKDDKFRLQTFSCFHSHTVNVGRIEKCVLLDKYEESEYKPFPAAKTELAFEIFDERNALERIMLHFSHFEKETKKLEEGHYEVKLTYDRDDETEVLIRVLSFGPMIKVISPESFVKQIKERIERQRKLRT